jgi:eukaryotic-like serine/threonine-protein kinase
MALTAGMRIGPYQIAAKVGEGGMGEVYRARDTTLDRDVALKVLPDTVARDPERLIRFEREAKALAVLSHPNIAQIYGLEGPPEGGPHDSVRAIVMEFIAGETLHGPLPLETALDYAQQIAAALEAAHEKGLVHRDLKPGNVMVTPEGVVKVLDFSLAGRAPTESTVHPDASPTLTMQASYAGVIVGTAAYMAPEQASGKTVDKRADIWAFGVVLWEMLTGKRLFEGETVSHVLAAVLTNEPDLSAVPSRVRPLLRRCLEKDPKKRLRDIGDAMSLVLSADAAEVADVAGRRSIRRGALVAGWSIAGALLLVLVAALWWRTGGEEPLDQPAVRFQIERSSDVYNRTVSAFAVSPNGQMLAYYPSGSDMSQAMLRTLATGAVRTVPDPLAGVPLGNSLFWSPDSRQLVRGTSSGGRIFNLSTGSVRLLCECRYVGGSWSPNGTILLGAFGDAKGIRRLSIDNAATIEITKPDTSRGEEDTWPVFLPDGRRFLFTRSTPNVGDATYLATLDGDVPQRIADGSQRIFVPAAGGRGSYLLGFDASGLVAQRFDPETMRVTGPATTMVAGAAVASASATGVIAASGAGNRPWTVPTWFDRKGTSRGQVGEAGYIEGIGLSFDGRKLATSVSTGTGDQRDIWIQDLASGARTRLTFSRGGTPVWSPDGRTLAFTTAGTGGNLPFTRAADGTGEERPLFAYDRPAWANDWSSDGKWVIYSTPVNGTIGNRLWALPMTGGDERKPIPYLVAAGIQQQAQFSPDGRFVAYGSDQSGRWEIYVQPFPNPSEGKWMVSTGGGVEPRWSRDGKELFYFSGQTLMAVPVSLRPSFSSGKPVSLFDAAVQPGYTGDSHRWQVAPDGQRFLLLVDAGKTQAPPLDIIVNWQALLPK